MKYNMAKAIFTEQVSMDDAIGGKDRGAALIGRRMRHFYKSAAKKRYFTRNGSIYW
jgi:hypothetical protein